MAAHDPLRSPSMRPGSPVRACIVALLVLSVSLTACSDDDPPPTTHTIGILRTVAGSKNEGYLLDVLADEGIDRAHLRIFGEDPQEVHADAADSERTVRDWVNKGVELIVALSTRTAAAAMKAAPTTPVL